MIKKLIISFFFLAVLITGFKVAYPLFLRDQIFWFVHNTSIGHFGVEFLQKTGLYDHGVKVKNTRDAYVLVLYQMLKDIHDVCGATNITYWADGGTLMGALRHKGFIPWDDDVDIQMMEKDYDRFLEVALPILEKLGYKRIGIQIVPTTEKFKTLGTENPPSCDIFAAVEVDGKLKIDWEQAIEVKDLLPLRLREFGDLKIWIHNNPHPYLASLYGENWMKQAKRGWDHLSLADGENSSVVPFHLEGERLGLVQPTGPLQDNGEFIRAEAAKRS